MDGFEVESDEGLGDVSVAMKHGDRLQVPADLFGPWFSYVRLWDSSEAPFPFFFLPLSLTQPSHHPIFRPSMTVSPRLLTMAHRTDTHPKNDPRRLHRLLTEPPLRGRDRGP